MIVVFHVFVCVYRCSKHPLEGGSEKETYHGVAGGSTPNLPVGECNQDGGKVEDSEEECQENGYEENHVVIHVLNF